MDSLVSTSLEQQVVESSQLTVPYYSYFWLTWLLLKQNTEEEE